MDRRSLIKNAGIAGVLAAGVAPAVHAQAAVRWRLASSFPKALDTIFGAAEVFAKQVKAMSGGKFEISVHAAGELMPAFGVVDGVQQGSIEAAHTAPYYFFGKNEAFALGCAIPFGLNSRQMTAWMYEGNGLKLMREFYAKYNMINFPGGNTGAQMGGWYRKEIKSLKDVKGMKMRIGGFGGKVLERIGGVPQNIPGGEIYTALEKGTIDAAEWVGPYDDQKLGFNKVAPFYYYPGWWEGGPQLDFFINQKAFDALSAENKAIVESAAAARPRGDAGQVRRPQPRCPEAAGGRRHQAASVPAGRDGRGLQGGDGPVRGAQRQEPGVGQDLRRLLQVPRRPEPVVPLHRSHLRPLHAGAEAVSRQQALAALCSRQRPHRGLCCFWFHFLTPHAPRQFFVESILQVGRRIMRGSPESGELSHGSSRSHQERRHRRRAGHGHRTCGACASRHSLAAGFKLSQVAGHAVRRR